MKFNWFPFDTQKCYFYIIWSTLMGDLILTTTPESLLTTYEQNTVLEYDVEFEELPIHMQKKKLEGPGVDELMKNFHPEAAEMVYDQRGFTYKLTRQWSKYIFIYYIPTSMCVLISWMSFFVKPEVIKIKHPQT